MDATNNRTWGHKSLLSPSHYTTQQPAAQLPISDATYHVMAFCPLTLCYNALAMPEAYINLRIARAGDKGFTATSPDFPGLTAQGDTITHAIEDARDKARKLAAELRQQGATLPLALRHADPDRIHIKLPVTMV